MTTSSAHELTRTVDCKVNGCVWDAVDRRGRYAGLCRDHKRETIEQDRRKRVAASEELRATGRTADGRIIAAAQEVLAAARSLERAMLAVYQAEQRREQAKTLMRARIGELVLTVSRELAP